eukprot:TRINITY_DN25671_c0_g1_i1.p2 TRINITY_DN25671_c0_g1~~TRINITY_DN25671_c0_g1_i1.p2  ORF type:complete len:151 (+),score=5.88 TRINITY_DN25671_c0_g1_i1:523-975(+)
MIQSCKLKVLDTLPSAKNRHCSNHKHGETHDVYQRSPPLRHPRVQGEKSRHPYKHDRACDPVPHVVCPSANHAPKDMLPGNNVSVTPDVVESDVNSVDNFEGVLKKQEKDCNHIHVRQEEIQVSDSNKHDFNKRGIRVVAQQCDIPHAFG